MTLDSAATLITGWNGFLGSAVCVELENQGGNIIRSGRAASSDVQWDLASKFPSVEQLLAKVVHVAGVAHNIHGSKEQALEAERLNTGGTRRLLEGLNPTLVQSFILVSSVSVYGLAKGNQITEDAATAPNTPYARSKHDSEILVMDWCEKNCIPYNILRLPLVIGAAAPGNLKRLVDAVKRNRFVLVNGGNTQKSMVLAKDVGRWISRPVIESGTYNLTDGIDPTYAKICKAICDHYGAPYPKDVPALIMKTVGLFGDISKKTLNVSFPYTSDTHTQMTQDLTFSNAKALATGWLPQPVLQTSEAWLE